MKKTTVIVLSLLAAGCFHDGGKTADASASPDSADSAAVEGPIVAEVNGVQIPESRLSVYAPVAAGEDRATIIENIVSSELIAQTARKAGLHLRPDIAEQLRVAEQTVLGRAYARDFIDNHPVSEEAVAAQYEEIKAETAGQSEYRTAHILVAEEELAKDLYEQVAQDGGKFSELAREHSQDPGSASQGGELGWVNPRALVPEYAAAMEDTAPGELAAAPVKTQFGWHIIRVDEKRPLSPPPMSDELRHGIEQSVRAELFAARLRELRDAADIVIH